MPTLYKIYTAVVAEELGGKLKSKWILIKNHTRFRKGMGTIYNGYVLNYMVNRRLEGKGKLVGLFVDLKAAFDTVNR